jgi:hypothetical protein
MRGFDFGFLQGLLHCRRDNPQIGWRGAIWGSHETGPYFLSRDALRRHRRGLL